MIRSKGRSFLMVLRLQAGHKYCLLGKLSSEVGWNHYDTIKVSPSVFLFQLCRFLFALVRCSFPTNFYFSYNLYSLLIVLLIYIYIYIYIKCLNAFYLHLKQNKYNFIVFIYILSLLVDCKKKRHYKFV